MTSRRRFLKIGAASAVIFGGGTIGYAYMPGTKRAIAPWSEAGSSFGDVRLDCLAYAILAPNPHNRQPWLFELVDDDRINVYCHIDKKLPHTDPYDRQITIGFGCMLELLRLAASAHNFDVAISSFPDGEAFPNLDKRRIAEIIFTKNTDLLKDDLFGYVLERRSTKEPYDMERAVRKSDFDVLLFNTSQMEEGSFLQGALEGPQTESLRDLIWRAFQVEYETPHTRRESIDLMRIGNREVTNSPDGIDMSGLAMGLMKMGGVINKKTLDTPGSMAYESGLGIYREMLLSTPGFIWLASEDNTRSRQLEMGRHWARLNLQATRLGLSIHPVSQALQEYEEMSSLYEELKIVLNVPQSHTVQMLGRLGYGPRVSASPRWPLQAKLVNI